MCVRRSRCVEMSKLCSTTTIMLVRRATAAAVLCLGGSAATSSVASAAAITVVRRSVPCSVLKRTFMAAPGCRGVDIEVTQWRDNNTSVVQQEQQQHHAGGSSSHQAYTKAAALIDDPRRADGALEQARPLLEAAAAEGHRLAMARLGRWHAVRLHVVGAHHDTLPLSYIHTLSSSHTGGHWRAKAGSW